MCTARTKIVAHVKDPVSTFRYGQWHGNTQITHNSSRIMKMIIVVTPKLMEEEEEVEGYTTAR